MTNNEYKPYEKLFRAICLQAKHDYLNDAEKIATLKEKFPHPDKATEKLIDSYAKDMTGVEEFFLTVGFKQSNIEKLRKMAAKRSVSKVKKTIRGE